MAGLAFGNLMRRAALLDGLGCFRRDVDGADGLPVRVEGGAGVLPLVPRANGLDQQGHFARRFIIHHLVLVATLHL